MTDTPSDIERTLREKIMACSDEERFIMGAQMFDSAMEMAKASLPPGLPVAERRCRLFNTSTGKNSTYGIDVG